MKQIRVSFKMISATALLALTVGCATTTGTQNRESMLVAAGFKTVTPKTTAHQQKLQKLPPGKVTMIQKAGKTYYIFPDAAHNQAYVGIRCVTTRGASETRANPKGQRQFSPPDETIPQDNTT